MPVALLRCSRYALLALALFGLNANIPAMGGEASSKKAKVCHDCGVIKDIRTVEKEGEGSGLGAVAGGVVGGLLGNQLGGGRGKTLTTIAGAGGGAYAGHQVEKNYKKTTVYEVSVKFDNGRSEVLSFAEQPRFAVGDKVKLVDGRLERR